MSAWSGLWPSPWPAEDGGPVREQAPRDLAGLQIAEGEQLRLAAVRDAFATTMVVLRDPGEVFVLRHTLGRRPLRNPSVSWVERIDPASLQPLARSPELAGGPFWPGGLAAHANGSLHVVHGRWCHRLSPELELLASRELPRPRPYNSFVVLADGTLAMKDLDRTLRDPARLTLLDPDTLAPRCEEVELPEPAIGRLAADGDTIYVVGATTIWRYRWDGTQLHARSGLGAALSRRRRSQLRLGSGDLRRARVVSRQRRASLRDDDARRRHRTRAGAADPGLARRCGQSRKHRGLRSPPRGRDRPAAV